jgi:hypothetical protein
VLTIRLPEMKRDVWVDRGFSPFNEKRDAIEPKNLAP